MKFKEYELKDHLGNVRATFNDLKYIVNGEFSLNNLETFNYYPFGMLEPTTQSYDGYRFGYNGMERDDEVKDKRIPPYGNRSGSGRGNSYDYGARFYDPRAARWFSRDPSADLTPSLSPFVMASNNPIFRVDRDGRKDAIYHANDLSEDLEAYDIGFVEKTLLTSGMYLVDILPNYAFNSMYHFDNLIGFDQIQMNYKNLYTNFYQNDATALSTVNERMIFLATLHAFQDFYHHSNYVELYIEWYQSKYSILAPIDLAKIPLYEDMMNKKENKEFKEYLKNSNKFRTGRFKWFFGEADKDYPFSHFLMNKDNKYASVLGQQIIPLLKNNYTTWFDVTNDLSFRQLFLDLSRLLPFHKRKRIPASPLEPAHYE